MRDSQPVRASLLMSGVTGTGVYSFMKLLNVGSREWLDGAAGAAVRVCYSMLSESNAQFMKCFDVRPVKIDYVNTFI